MQECAYAVRDGAADFHNEVATDADLGVSHHHQSACTADGGVFGGGAGDHFLHQQATFGGQFQ